MEDEQTVTVSVLTPLEIFIFDRNVSGEQFERDKNFFFFFGSLM